LSKERAVIELINVILGANMSSRLFEEIREKQALCYDISTSTAKYKDAGAFTIKLGLDKNKIKPAILTILRELKKMKNINVGAQELMRAKDYLLGQTAMGLEQPQGRMFYVAQFYLTLGKIYTFNQVKEEVTKVTPKEIRELSNRIFDFENICVASVGDLSKTGEEIIRDAIKEAAS
jgi:predicted Zn-dependent peptidase